MLTNGRGAGAGGFGAATAFAAAFDWVRAVTEARFATIMEMKKQDS